MRKILDFVNIYLKQFGLKVKLIRVVRNKSNHYILKGISKFISNKSIAVVYLDVGDDTDDFVLNSIISFRRYDIETRIIVYSNRTQKKYFDFCHKYDFKVRKIEEYNEIKGTTAYFDFGTDKFNNITNQKWSIILSTFEEGYEIVIYTDFDIVFLDSPVNYINKIYEKYALMVQSESVNVVPPSLCSGFMVFNKSSLLMLKDLKSISKNFDDNDQVLLNRFLNERPELKDFIHVLPEALFANGLHWKSLLGSELIDGLNINTDSIKPILFHANYLVGLKNKKSMLEQLNLWLL